jgi:hypothetical protein
MTESDDFDCGIEEESVWDRMLLGEATPGDAMELREMAEENVRLRAESEGRRNVLFEKAEELRQAWQRAEIAEAEVARLRKIEAAARKVSSGLPSGGPWGALNELRAALEAKP